MKIYFSPGYASGTYFKMEGAAFDTVVCDVPKFVPLLELHLGIHHEEKGTHDLSVLWLKAMLEMDKRNPDNVFHESLLTDAVATARMCLEWRDRLVLAGWKPSMKASRRIDAIAATEAHFGGITLADRIVRLPSAILDGILPEMELILPYSHELMHPAYGAVIEALRQKGVPVCCQEETQLSDCNLKRVRDWLRGKTESPKISSQDDSLEIIMLDTDEESDNLFHSLEPDEYDVLISNDESSLDSIFRSCNIPSCGSRSSDSLPQIVQLLPLAINMFIYPANINKLAAWLRSPRSPLPSVRYQLADILLGEGGYAEELCARCLNEYVEKHSEDERRIRKAVATFLRIPTPKGVDKESFLKFIDAFENWARGEVGAAYEPEQACQFSELLARICEIRMLADMEPDSRISQASLEKWMLLSCEGGSYMVRQAERGSHNVVESPANIIGDIEKLLWCSFASAQTFRPMYSFLSASEKTALEESGCNLYKDERESQMLREEDLWPFCHVRYLCLIEKTEDYLSGVRSVLSQQLRSLDSDSRANLLGMRVCNVDFAVPDSITHFPDGGVPESIEISNSKMLNWREHESNTSLDQLIQHPLEYVLNYGLGLRPVPEDEIKVKTSAGNVAHHIVEQLFLPGLEAAEIKANLECSFNTALDKALVEKGMLLLLPENKAELTSLKSRLRNALEDLVDILASNGLKMVGCEKTLTDDTLLGGGPALEARLDMHLTSSDGKEVIIDLKWSDSPAWYEGKIKDNHAMQLYIYGSVLKRQNKCSDVVYGYFIMPQGRLYTAFPLKGKAVSVIQSDADALTMMEKIARSYEYRRAQIQAGTIEIGDKCPAEDLQYYNDTAVKNLYPLETTGKKPVRKAESKFSNYGCFTNDAIVK